ncbi:neuromedin-B isoform X2 [Sturnira hondurensis]|uniref:neuromedin-B isoform X2 n=1 Tax=Sturnira hondurensis TaxID=192404 RepID=UPI00187A2BD2|nr:neuromedin-B isoform X2 [Sturnira hondurensis]
MDNLRPRQVSELAKVSRPVSKEATRLGPMSACQLVALPLSKTLLTSPLTSVCLLPAPPPPRPLFLLHFLLCPSPPSLSGPWPIPSAPRCAILSTPSSCSGKGHFMGKKSVKPPSPPLLGTAPHLSLRDPRLQLSHDLLRILLLRKALGTSPGGPPPRTQYRRLLVRMLQK